jgi:hypothetical protein
MAQDAASKAGGMAQDAAGSAQDAAGGFMGWLKGLFGR